MTANLDQIEGRQLFKDVTLNGNSVEKILNLQELKAVGNMSLQATVGGGNSGSVSFTYQLSNNWNPNTKTGSFAIPSDGNSIMVVTDGNENLQPVSVYPSLFIKIIATETANQDSVVNGWLSTQ